MRSSRIHPARWLPPIAALGATAPGIAVMPAEVSSHRETAAITTMPKLDATDFCTFLSYEPERDGYIPPIANDQPLQAAHGGPNCFQMDPNALCEIRLANVGDAKEHLSLRFKHALKAITLNIAGAVTASLRQGQLLNDPPKKGQQTAAIRGGAWIQGLPDKDCFNVSRPKDDAQFADYLTHPTLPRLLDVSRRPDPARSDQGGAR